MSIKTMTRVWDHSTHDGTTLLTLLALADWSDQDGICWYKNRSIGKRIRKQSVGDRTVKRILSKLRKSGELFTIQHDGERYLFVTTALPQAVIAQTLLDRFDFNEADAWAKAKAIKNKQRGDKNDTPKGDTDDTPRVTSGSPPINNHQPPVSKTTNDPPTNHQTEAVETEKVLTDFGIPKATAVRLASLPHVTADYARAIIADVRNDRTVRKPVGAAIRRLEIEWHVEVEPEHPEPYKQKVPAEYADIIRR